jgi:hypothetical protein
MLWTDPHPTLMTYLLVSAGTLAVSWIGAWAAVKFPKRALQAFITTFALFLISIVINHDSLAASTESKTLFLWLKPFSVYVPVVLLAYVNLKLQGKDEVPLALARLFSVILSFNLLQTALYGLDTPDLASVIYIGLTIVISLAALRLKWEVKRGVLGFTDKTFVIANLTCLSYLYLFLFPPGTGWLSWAILLVPYIPTSRMGHAWFAFRAYSLGIYLIFTHTLGLVHFYRALPVEIAELMANLKGGPWPGLVLLAGAVSVAFLVHAHIRQLRGHKLTDPPSPATP